MIEFVENTGERGQSSFESSYQLQGSPAPGLMLTKLLLPPTELKGSNTVTSVTHFCPSLSVGKVRFKKKKGGELTFYEFWSN